MTLRKDWSLPKPAFARPTLLRPFDSEQPPSSAREPRHDDLLLRLQQYRIRNAVTAKASGWKAQTGKLSTMLEYDRGRVATVNLAALRRAIVVEQKRPQGKRPFIPRYVEEAKLPPLFS